MCAIAIFIQQNYSLTIVYCVGKFEVVFLSSAIGHEQTVLVVMLKSTSRINRYLAINKKGKVQITKVLAK